MPRDECMGNAFYRTQNPMITASIMDPFERAYDGKLVVTIIVKQTLCLLSPSIALYESKWMESLKNFHRRMKPRYFEVQTKCLEAYF
jgi:hypothetical protein